MTEAQINIIFEGIKLSCQIAIIFLCFCGMIESYKSLKKLDKLKKGFDANDN